MKTFYRYLWHRLIRSLPVTAAMAGIALLLSVAFVDVSLYHYEFECLPITLFGLCLLLPVLEFSPFQSRRSLDTLFSLPISRTALGLAHYINGILRLILCFLPSLLYTFFLSCTLPAPIRSSYLLLYGLCVLGLGILLYTYFVFAFLQGNTVIDGVIHEVLYIFVFLFLLGVWNWNTLPWNLYLPFSGTPFGIFSDLHEIFRYAIIGKSLLYFDLTVWQTVDLILWCALFAAAAVGAFFSFRYRKTERVEGLSHSFFGYRVLIPVCGISLVAGDFKGSLPSVIVSLILMAVGYGIYRRSVKLHRSDLILLAIATAVGIALILLP